MALEFSTVVPEVTSFWEVLYLLRILTFFGRVGRIAGFEKWSVKRRSLVRWRLI